MSASTLVGIEGDYEGRPYRHVFLASDVLIATPGAIEEVATLLAHQLGDLLGVPNECQDDDWRARFRVTVQPMTQADMDIYRAYGGD